MATSLKELVKEVQIDHLAYNKYLSFGKTIAKIGPVDPEIIDIWVIKKKKKKEINARKYITRLVSLPTGIKYFSGGESYVGVSVLITKESVYWSCECDCKQVDLSVCSMTRQTSTNTLESVSAVRALLKHAVNVHYCYLTSMLTAVVHERYTFKHQQHWCSADFKRRDVQNSESKNGTNIITHQHCRGAFISFISSQLTWFHLFHLNWVEVGAL